MVIAKEKKKVMGRPRTGRVDTHLTMRPRIWAIVDEVRKKHGWNKNQTVELMILAATGNDDTLFSKEQIDLVRCTQ